MIQEVKKKRRRAEELAQIWESYFPTMPVGIEYWMVGLEDFPFNVMALAIKQAARGATTRKRVQLKGEMTLEQVLTYMQSVCRTILKEKVALHIYPERQRGEAAVRRKNVEGKLGSQARRAGESTG
ncbi:MAG: hypothetical protein ACYCOR_20830 [Acidobacteriaceae bacterium]